jgi:hypothetical protein
MKAVIPITFQSLKKEQACMKRYTGTTMHGPEASIDHCGMNHAMMHPWMHRLADFWILCS